MRILNILPACLFLLPLLSSGQRGAISGEGEIVKQEISLEKIHGIWLGFSGDVILTQGQTQKIVLEGQQNVLDNIKRQVEDGIWHIYFEKNVRQHKSVKIYVTLSDLTDVSLSGSGNISSSGTFNNLGDLDIAVSGSGDIQLSILAGRIDCAVSGSGEVKLEGSGTAIDIAISGSGDVDASGLHTMNCEVAISGSGDALVYCTQSLDAAISGSGDIGYRGGATKVRAAVNGSGDVTEMD